MKSFWGAIVELAFLGAVVSLMLYTILSAICGGF